MTLLAVDSISASRGGWLVFEGLSFALEKGEIVLIKGINGVGKSSLLRILAGITDPVEGKVERAPQLTHLYIGHTDGLPESASIKDSLVLQAKLLSPKEDPESLVMRALQEFDLDLVQDLPPQSLSAGQRRRAALTRLFLAQREVWMLDEPQSHLDADGQAILWQSINNHCQNKGSVILTSHQDLPFEVSQTITLGGAIA